MNLSFKRLIQVIFGFSFSLKPAVAFAIREQLYEVKTLIVTLSYSLCISVYSIYVFYFEQECQTY